nr:CUAEP/CCAEP-tail radical SAM protein [Acidobacteriota bacterium]
PRVDALQAEVIALVGQHGTASRRAIFEEIWTLAHERAALHCPLLARNIQARVAIPYLNEPWYC